VAYAIELFLDPRTDRTIHDLWKEIAVAGVSSYMLDTDSTPHLTLSVCDSLDPIAFRPALEELASQMAPFRLVFSSLGVFKAADSVVFLAPVVTAPLLSLHAAMHEVLERFTATPWAHYLPERWVPHCTLAMKLLPMQVGSALQYCKLDLPIFGRAQEIALVEFFPVRTVYRMALGPGEEGRRGRAANMPE